MNVELARVHPQTNHYHYPQDEYYLDLDLCDLLERVRLLERDRDLDLLERDLDLLRRLLRSLERLRDLERRDLLLDCNM
ncbi:hypothetical protein E2C01_018565 [Portunus trituberculatus]|uniref:Uncharacterized protein n=1 Tax=Portunus trituberculatus TaxID=210409 RepID=A0A5B7DUS8_PORTR|nr:hypothetical protein [Portunus trituberculatus]